MTDSFQDPEYIPPEYNEYGDRLGPREKKGKGPITMATSTKAKTKATSSKRGARDEEDDDESDPWELGSGMADQFIGYIQEPFFGVDEDYNPDAMLFNATLVDEDGEPITTLKYSVGQGWETDDDGEVVEHPSKSKINNNSRYGRFIDRLISPDDTAAPKSKSVVSPKGKGNGLALAKMLKKRGSPFKAATFDGLGFFWELHEMETMGKNDDGSVATKSVLLPTEYIGEYENGSSSSSGSKKKSSAKTTGKISKKSRVEEEDEDEDEDEEDLSSQIPPKLRRALTSQASSSTAKEFVRSAAKDKGVIALPDEVMEYILNAGKDGFWASAQEDEDEDEEDED